LARDIEDDQSGLTRDGVVIGTMDYVSPEQAADSKHVDARGDIYSLGCALYFALAGHPPFGGETVLEKLYKHRMEDPAPLEHAARGVPAEFAAVVRKMMAKNPDDRYQSADELSVELARWTDPTRVKQLLGAAAESGQAFRPPPPEIQDTELQLGDTKLRALGNDEPSDAPLTPTRVSTARSVQIRKPLERLRPPSSATEPREPDASSWLFVAVLVGVGLLMLIGVIFVSQM
jgi:serine/threonine-protein kinase